MSDISKKDNDIVKGQITPAFIKDKKAILFIYRKLERITAALYMVTNILPLDEPMRLKLRSLGIEVFSDILSLYRAPQEANIRNRLGAHIFEIVSLLGIAHISQHISSMNHTVLVREYNAILVLLEEEKDTLIPEENSVVDDTFFSSIPTEPLDEATSQEKTLDRGAVTEGQKQQPFIKDTFKKTTRPRSKIPRSSARVPDAKKHERRDVILGLLRERKRISVRDVALIVTDCSEKTLQRELLAMVEEGILRKEGERRWSTYSLL